MRKLIYFVASTLDGFIAGTDGADPSTSIFDPSGAHAGPLMAEYPEMIPGHVRSVLGVEGVPNKHFDTILEGRGSYEIGTAAGIGDAYPHLRHLVFSTTLDSTSDPAVELVGSAAVDRVRALKDEQGLDIWLCGGGCMAASLRDEIDEIHLKLYPVVLGDGIPLFGRVPGGESEIDRYTLNGARVFDSGVALMTYARA